MKIFDFYLTLAHEIPVRWVIFNGTRASLGDALGRRIEEVLDNCRVF